MVYISESLNDEVAAPEAWGDVGLEAELGVLQDFPGSVEDSEPGGLGPASDASLVECLSGDHSGGVDVLMAGELGVGVLHPAHLPFASPEVGPGHVHGCADHVLLRQLDREPPHRALDLPAGVLLGVHLEASLAAAVGQVQHCVLQGHQQRQCFHLVDGDVLRKTGTTSLEDRKRE